MPPVPKVNDFRDLIVWQRATDFVVEVYRLTQAFPTDERFGLISQLRRSAVSVSSNIAEGSGRTTLKDRRHFYGVSRGSLKEAESLIYVSQKLGFVTDAACTKALALANETGRMLTTLRQNLRGK